MTSATMSDSGPSESDIDPSELAFPITERDMLGAMEVLSTAAEDTDVLMILTDEELAGIDGPSANAVLGDPFLSRSGVDRTSSCAAAVRSLAARRLARPRGEDEETEEPEGDIITGAGELRPLQLDRSLAGVLTLRRIPEALVIVQRTLAGGTTVLAEYMFPAGGVLEEYVSIDGFHHFSVPALDDVPSRLARFVDPFEDASEDGEIETITLPTGEADRLDLFPGARSLAIVTSLGIGEGSQATIVASEGRMQVLDNGRIDTAPAEETGPDAAGVERTEHGLSAVSPETLLGVLIALIPVVEHDDEESDSMDGSPSGDGGE